MCGRYYVDDETAREIERIVRQVDERLSAMEPGDIRPTDMATVLVNNAGIIDCSRKRWGIPGAGQDQSKLIINGRAETVNEKIMFRDQMKRHRIVIPAAGFYEWNAAGEKNIFYREKSRILYMAGFYKRYEDVDRFVILTTAANESMSPVHDRMPLILEASELEKWLFEDGFAEEFLRKTPPLLQRKSEYEQLKLF